MSKYGDQTHCENLDCVSQSEIGQAGYLLNPPRTYRCKWHPGTKGNKVHKSKKCQATTLQYAQFYQIYIISIDCTNI